MMPSRGLHLVRSNASRLRAQQCRNLSSAARSSIRDLSRTSRPSVLRRPILSSPSQLNIALAASSIRHASTTPTTSPAAPTASATESQSFPNLDTITLDNLDLSSTSDIANIPEHVGYLSKIGIDYGWGITSGVQWILEHLHISAGLPWWAAIAATAVAVRVVTFPLYLKSSDSMARQNALSSVTKPLMDRMREAQKAGDTALVMMTWQQLGQIRKRAGIRLRDQFTPMVLQGIIGFCGFRLMRAMSTLPVPGLVDGGFLWLTDLTMTDGYLLMPVIMAASTHLLIRLGGESANAGAQMPPGMKTFMWYGMPSLLGLVSAFQPGAVLMWFAGSGSIGMAQALLLQNPGFRKRLGLAPIYKPAEGEAGQNLFYSMLEDRKKAPSPAAPNPGPAVSKRASYMRPAYQAPNIRTVSTEEGRVINASLVKNKASTGESEDMVQPTKKRGMFDSVTDTWNQAKDRAREQMQQRSEVDPKADYKRRADEYERNWRKAQDKSKAR